MQYFSTKAKQICVESHFLLFLLPTNDKEATAKTRCFDLSESGVFFGTMPPGKIVICGAGLHGSALAFYLTQMGHTGDCTARQLS